jgi:ribosomal protein S28E/S33
MSISQPGPPVMALAQERVDLVAGSGADVAEDALADLEQQRQLVVVVLGRAGVHGGLRGSTRVSGDVLDGGEAVLEAVAGPVDRDDVAVVQEPVEDRGGQNLVAEDLACTVRNSVSATLPANIR